MKTKEEICIVYGNAAIYSTTVKNWFAEIPKFELDDKPRSDGPKKTEDENRTQKLVIEDVTPLIQELERY